MLLHLVGLVFDQNGCYEGPFGLEHWLCRGGVTGLVRVGVFLVQLFEHVLQGVEAIGLDFDSLEGGDFNVVREVLRPYAVEEVLYSLVPDGG